MTSCGMETMNIGAPMTGKRKRSSRIGGKGMNGTHVGIHGASMAQSVDRHTHR
jgi:hypothetical protein